MVTILCNELSQLKGEDAVLKDELRALRTFVLGTPGLWPKLYKMYMLGPKIKNAQ
jgi:hypothetical protein